MGASEGPLLGPVGALPSKLLQQASLLGAVA
jgi:hypothetical protein